MESYRDKVLIVSEGNIKVRVEQDEAARPVGRAIPPWWLAVMAVAVVVALVSSATTLYTIFNFQREMTVRLDTQTQRFADRIDAAFADARSRSDDQVGSLLLRADTLDTKLELIPDRIDTAAQGMTTVMEDSIATIRRTLNGSAPFANRTSPILLIKRRKAF